MNKRALMHRFVRGLHLFVIAVLLAGFALAAQPIRTAWAGTTP